MNMRRPTVARRVAAVAAALAAVTAALVVPANPAYAGPEPQPERYSDSSHHTAAAFKTVKVDCPDEWGVFSGGGEIIAPPGAAALTAVVPDPSDNSVTVSAVARPNFGQPWTLVAYAVCEPSAAPTPVIRSTNTESTISATCPNQGRLFGWGFLVDSPSRQPYVDEVLPGPDLRAVRVRAGNMVVGRDRLTVIAMCRPPAEAMERLSGVSEPGAQWPLSATAVDESDRRVFAVGGAVRGPGAFLDALVPDPDTDSAYVRGVLPGATASGRLSARAGASAMDGGDDGAVAHADSIGTFH